ncbi:MAG: STAS domain-containing protein [Pirellulales bacterium]|nr:STAS domain-containing protein [Pirellulales bacterium]
MLETHATQETIVIAFEGSLDTARCEELDAEIRAAVASPAGPVVFDLDKVDFIASSFLRLCIHAQRQAGGQGFHVVNESPLIKRVFKIAGLDAMLKA